jgi:phosphonopyruvate decarboxylase
MIDPSLFYKLLAEHGAIFTGVPDSLLKNFCACAADSGSHITAVNEGAAVALAAGYHLATGKIPLVYMQNSGIGNAINPLLSLADGDVYRIPMILLIGWRGEPGVKDEPQHLKQGKVTCALFETMEIPYRILPDSLDEARAILNECLNHIKRDNTPFALIARKDTFAPYASNVNDADDTRRESEMSREEAIEHVIRSSAPDEIFVSTTGMASRELYELREKEQMGHERDFLTVGSMGHASSLALAIAIQKPALRVNCIDGDGAALMHLGGMATVGTLSPPNLRHIILNNGAHDSVGGQPTIARNIDLAGIARSCGYSRVYSVKTTEELRQALSLTADKTDGAVFIEALVRKGGRSGLGRPKSSPIENKEAFTRFIADGGKAGIRNQTDR